MKRIVSALVCVLVSALSSQAANVAWVSFHAADNAPASGAAGNGFTRAPDVGYTDLLSANGYNVTRFVITQEFAMSQVSGFDLVIVGRSVPSDAFGSATETAAWNGFGGKLLNMGGYTMRDSRLGLYTASNIADTTNTISLKPTGLHPIFAGIPIDGLTGNMFNPFAGIVTYDVGAGPFTAQGISVSLDPLDGNPTVLATVGTAGARFGAPMIALWGIGSTVTPGGRSDVLGGYRMAFFSGSRENSTQNSQTAGIYDLTPDGAKLFLNSIGYFLTVIPEPSTVALFALGGIALLLRRRK